MYHILCIDIKEKIMKLNKVILLLAFVLIISPAIAYDITEETTTPEYKPHLRHTPTLFRGQSSWLSYW